MNTSTEPAYALRTTSTPSAWSHHELPVTYAVRWQVENTLSPLAISDMTCMYFDDMPVQRLMVGKFMGKMWFKDSSVFDTGKNFTSACEATAESESLAMKKVVSVEEIKERVEWEKMKEVHVVVTDINDTDSVTDPSGWLRRGKMALEAWKIVVFVSGHVDNKEVIDREFSAQYGGQYIFLAKPYELTDIQKSIQELIARRGES